MADVHINRLSALQRRILGALADHSGDQHATTMTYADLRDAVRDYWPPDHAERSRTVAFSRALHRLHRAGLVDALALAWVTVDPDGEPDDIVGWAGGGPRARVQMKGGRDADGQRLEYETTVRRPRLNHISLTDDARWQLANPDE